MPEDEKFLTQDPGEMTPVERDLAMSKIQATGSPYFNETNPLSKIYRDQAEKIYALKYPEPEGRQSELEDQRGLSDILRKEGLETKEKIFAEGERGREEIFTNKAVQDANACEAALKLQWGNASYNERLGIAKYFFKEYFTPADREWADLTPDSPGAVSPSNDPKFIKLLTDLGEYISGHNKKFDVQLRKYFSAKEKKK